MALHLFSTSFFSSLSCKRAHRLSEFSKIICYNFNKKSSRRTAAALAASLLAAESLPSPKTASAFEFKLIAPDQTLEEADAVVKIHARQLLQIKPLIDSRSWREVQISLRESSSLLKQDLYTIIQARPGMERPQLRKLYSDLFNTVTRGLRYSIWSWDYVHIRAPLSPPRTTPIPEVSHCKRGSARARIYHHSIHKCITDGTESRIQTVRLSEALYYCDIPPPPIWETFNSSIYSRKLQNYKLDAIPHFLQGRYQHSFSCFN